MANKTIKEKALELLDEKNNNLSSEVLKDGVQVFGITGSYGSTYPLFDLDAGLKLAYYKNEILPEFILNANWGSCENFSLMFCRTNLSAIPLIDTSSATSMINAFFGCEKITTIPQLNTSKVIDMSSMLSGCVSLVTIPLLDTSSVTSMSFMVSGCTSIQGIPAFNTNKVRYINKMFENCSNLVDVPVFNLPVCTEMNNMFYKCNSLSDNSLNNILASCISAVSVTSNKTLKYIGLTQAQADICETLSNYQAFLNAGWTTGY